MKASKKTHSRGHTAMEHKAAKLKITKQKMTKHNAALIKGSYVSLSHTETYTARKNIPGYSKIKQLQEEQEVNPAVKPHVCPHCGLCFNDRANLNKHVDTHSEYETAKSTCWCKRQFSTSAQLKIHQTAKKCFSEANLCIYCNERFCTYGGLTNHIKAKHLPSCKCPECGEEFINQMILKAHMLNHTGSFKCYECDEVFSKSDLLTAHIRGIHIKARTCPFCGKTLSTRGSLTQHIATHTKKKSERFSDCGTVETHKDDCVSLKPTCPDETRCSQCGEVFSRAVTKKESPGSSHNPIICLPCTEAFSQLFGLELDV